MRAVTSREHRPMTDPINADLSARAVADTTLMEWAPSPSASVWRKRVHLVGAPESGEVTSIVRYDPHAKFPAHDHPGGEEILVLEGIFSDEHGDWPQGTLLLNPEGFRHAPFSESGCVLFVKLRQFAGRERKHVAVDTRALPWSRGADSAIACKELYRQAGFAEVMRLERWAPGADPGVVVHDNGTELLVLDGQLMDEAGSYRAGCWLRLPAGAQHHPRSPRGCTLYTRTGGLSRTRPATA